MYNSTSNGGLGDSKGLDTAFLAFSDGSRAFVSPSRIYTVRDNFSDKSLGILMAWSPNIKPINMLFRGEFRVFELISMTRFLK